MPNPRDLFPISNTSGEPEPAPDEYHFDPTELVLDVLGECVDRLVVMAGELRGLIAQLRRLRS